MVDLRHLLAGVVVLAIGLAITLRARQRLGPNWSGIVAVKKGHTLIRKSDEAR